MISRADGGQLDLSAGKDYGKFVTSLCKNQMKKLIYEQKEVKVSSWGLCTLCKDET